MINLHIPTQSNFFGFIVVFGAQPQKSWDRLFCITTSFYEQQVKQRHDVIFRHQHELYLPQEILEAGAAYLKCQQILIDLLTCAILVSMDHFPSQAP